MSRLLEKMLEHNKTFVANGDWERYASHKHPQEKLAVVSCMDTRLVELLPAALGMKNSDINLIKNGGGIITHPFDSAMFSLLVAVYHLEVEEIAVIGHYDCGVQGLEAKTLLNEMLKRGVKRTTIDMLNACGLKLETWLQGFGDTQEAVLSTMKVILDHPLMPEGILVHGLIMDPRTGRVDQAAESRHVSAKATE
jgi:carbonic anhydrase